MAGRVLIASVCIAIVVATSALPAPRILPGQTLHLEQAQVTVGQMTPASP